MRFLFIIALSLIAHLLPAQTVLVMDFVKVKNGKYAEAQFFYENNWKMYLDIALQKKIIESYRLEKVIADTAGMFDFVLITEYKDTTMYRRSEENFRSILATIRPNGPILLNEWKPADFRTNVFVKVTETVYSNDRKKKRSR